MLLPLGRRLLIESEFEMSTDLTHSDGQWGPAVVDHGIEYLQLNYIVHPNLTVTAGRFLTPFGIYRERLHPMWIRNLASEPIIFAMNDNSSNGAMVRGTAPDLRSGHPYVSYFSASTKNNQLLADRRAGTRVSMFVPGKRFEVGMSFSRVLDDSRYNMLGTDVTWNLKHFHSIFGQRVMLVESRRARSEAAGHLSFAGKTISYDKVTRCSLLKKANSVQVSSCLVRPKQTSQLVAGEAAVTAIR